MEPDEVPPEDALPGPPVSEEVPGGQSLLLIEEEEEDELPLELPLLGEVDSLPGGQFEAAVEPEALLLGELVSDELGLGELLSDELVLGELVLGELEYEPLDCAIAPAENASSALAVAAASNLSFMRGTPFQGMHRLRCVVGIVRNLDRARRGSRASDVPVTCANLSRCLRQDAGVRKRSAAASRPRLRRAFPARWRAGSAADRRAW